MRGVRFSNVKPVAKGTLLLSFKLTIGRVSVAGRDLFTNEAIAAIRPSSEAVLPGFLYHSLPAVAKNAVTDTAIKGVTLNKQKLASLIVRFPRRIEVQQLIVSILDAIDQHIEKTEALITKYQQIKAGLMHDLFTRGVTPDGKLRPPREQAPGLYRETAIGWIPNEWDVSELAAKASPGIPHLRTGPFGSALKGEHWVEDGWPVITIGALGEGRFIESELLYIGDTDAARLKEFQLKPGDVVFSRVADVGRSIVIRAIHSGWIMSSNLMRISLDRTQVIPDFLQQQLAFDARLKSQIRAKVNSGGRDVANSDILNRLLFVWPHYGEQEMIVARAMAVDAQCGAEEAMREKLIRQKLGLMHDLLTGKVRVPLDTPAPEPAHAWHPGPRPDHGWEYIASA